jgi:hypothetical protein
MGYPKVRSFSWVAGWSFISTLWSGGRKYSPVSRWATTISASRVPTNRPSFSSKEKSCMSTSAATTTRALPSRVSSYT